MRGGLLLQGELVGVLAARKLHAETLDAHPHQFFGVFQCGAFARVVAVVGDVNSLGAMLSKRRFDLVSKTIHAVAGGHVPIARAPERERIDQRFTQDDFFRRDQRWLVPYATMRTWQIQVLRCVFAQQMTRRDFAPVHLHHFAFQVEDRNHYRAAQVFASVFAEHAYLGQASALLCASAAVFLGHAVTECAVGEAQAEVLHHLRRLQAAFHEILLRLGRVLQRPVIVLHHGFQQSLVVGRMLDERRQFHRRGFSRRRFRAAHGRKVVPLEHFHGVIEAHAFGAHHPQDHVAAFAAGTLAVPDVLQRIDVETGIGVFVEGTEADEFLAAAP